MRSSRKKKDEGPIPSRISAMKTLQTNVDETLRNLLTQGDAANIGRAIDN